MTPIVSPWYANPIFWLYFAAWLPFTALAFWYGLTGPRKKDAIGRSLLAVKSSLALVLTVVLTAFIFPGYEWRRALLFTGIALVACAGWYQLAIFVRTRRQGRRKDCLESHRSEEIR